MTITSTFLAITSEQTGLQSAMARFAEKFWRALAVAHMLACPCAVYILAARNILARANITAVSYRKRASCGRNARTVTLDNIVRLFTLVPKAILADTDTTSRGPVAPPNRWIEWVRFAAL